MVPLLDHHEGDPWLVAVLQLGARLPHLTQLVLQHLGAGWGVGYYMQCAHDTVLAPMVCGTRQESADSDVMKIIRKAEL